MEALRILLGVFVIVLSDISSGTLIAHFLMKAMNHPPAFPTYIVAIIIVLLPDIIELHLKSEERKYRSSSHRPIIIVLPLLLILIFPFWALLTVLCLISHFVHDSLWFNNRGIQWLWPIRQGIYRFFAREAGGKMKVVTQQRKVLFSHLSVIEDLKAYPYRPEAKGEIIYSTICFLLVIASSLQSYLT